MKLAVLRLPTQWLLGQIEDDDDLELLVAMAERRREWPGTAAAENTTWGHAVVLSSPVEMLVLTIEAQAQLVGKNQLMTFFHSVLLPMEKLTVDLRSLVALELYAEEISPEDGAPQSIMISFYRAALASRQEIEQVSGRRTRAPTA